MLKKEDYEERDCPLCMRTDDVRPIAISRMVERLDALLAKDDTEGASRHLSYWLEEARAGKDVRGEIAVLNEQMGLLRKMGNEEGAFAAAHAAEKAILRAHLEDTLTAATVRLNHATVASAFGKTTDAIRLYRETMAVYDALLSPSDTRYAALQNNLAAALTAEGAYAEARALYEAALATVSEKPESYPDAAITLLNMADLVYREKGAEQSAEEICALCTRADTFLSDARTPRDGYLAFVADKCVDAFRFHGFFLLAEKYARLSHTLYGKDGGTA